MNFKVDENLPVEIADILREAGHQASTVVEQGLGGAEDSHIASVCRQEELVLITLDLDFADIRTYPPRILPGVLILRLERQDKPNLLKIFTQLLPILSQGRLEGNLWIVDENRIRVRNGPTY